MSRLIVVSNRVSPPADQGDSTVGGLAMAIAAALREYKGIWFGWSGNTVEQFSGQLSMHRIAGVTVATIDLEEQDVQEYYNGYANNTLWPLFHYRIDLTAYERSFGQGYDRVNARFAEMMRPLIEPNDLIWVHDYHLIPLARELRKLGIANRIGFFLHIPWPARQLVVTLPRHRQLVEALFDYDLVGFQAEDWLDAFEGYVRNEAGGSVESGVASAFGKTARIGAFPIGLDTKDFVAGANSESGRSAFQRMTESLNGRRMLVGVDRLDYSKGLEERLLAYEQCLVDHPDLREKIFLLQIATPSRDAVGAYQEIRAKLEALTGHINGKFATVDWVPVRYVNTSHRRDELAGIFRSAAVGVVTPLRDGMNLVAKEYVAAQDPADPGVLILSRFAGAAAQMREAIIVNPFSREDVSDAIKRALAMPAHERKARWETLMHGVMTHNVMAWRDSYVNALEHCR